MLTRRAPNGWRPTSVAGQEGVIEWQFDRAFPCKWMGPELNAAQNNVAVETLELCYHTLKRAS